MRIADIAREVSEETGVSVEDIRGLRRFAHFVDARDAVVKRACIQGYSTGVIGSYLGGRDHTSIIHLRDRGAGIPDEYKPRRGNGLSQSQTDDALELHYFKHQSLTDTAKAMTKKEGFFISSSTVAGAIRRASI